MGFKVEVLGLGGLEVKGAGFDPQQPLSANPNMTKIP